MTPNSSGRGHCAVTSGPHGRHHSGCPSASWARCCSFPLDQNNIDLGEFSFLLRFCGLPIESRQVAVSTVLGVSGALRKKNTITVSLPERFFTSALSTTVYLKPLLLDSLNKYRRGVTRSFEFGEYSCVFLDTVTNSHGTTVSTVRGVSGSLSEKQNHVGG